MTRTTIFQAFLLLAILIGTIVACKKGFDEPKDEILRIDKFNPAAVKEWWYGTFVKSAEWTSYYSGQKNNKLVNSKVRDKSPDWNHGTYRKVGNMEIVEFPLIKGVASLLLPLNSKLTASNRKRIAEASLTRIAFIKKGDGNIIVREIDYIPDWGVSTE